MIYAILFILLAWLAGSPRPPAPPPAYDCDAALTALFTPRQPQAGTYAVCTTASPLDEAVEADTRVRGARVSAADAVDPLDAFGASGPYDRAALSSLYGGRRARVARGWWREGRVLVSATYISPHPDRGFTTLVPGTLVIRYILENRGL
jgi:hypothetical protein